MDVEATIKHRREERASERHSTVLSSSSTKTSKDDEKSNLNDVDHIMDGLEVPNT